MAVATADYVVDSKENVKAAPASSAQSAAPGGGASTSNGAPNPANPDEPPRTSRACLACRKLKTRCDGADDPPCKRCRTGGHECIFVESKRGKRPVKKPQDPSIADKLRKVETTLSRVLESMNSGTTPDQQELEQLKADLADGLKADAEAKEKEKAKEAKLQKKNEKKRRESDATGDGQDASPSGSEEGTSSKRARLDSIASGGDMDDDDDDFYSPISSIPSLPATTNSAPALSILADASLAAEIEGRAQVTGLDANFNLSSVTQALEDGKDGRGAEQEGKAPPLLTKGIIDAETAVELFRIFFDYAYIHLPLLDPTYSTATSILGRSPFLFTVICAVASRFHKDPNLHVSCYEEAHACFVECVATGERSLESVQACMILTLWTSAPREGTGEDRPKRAWLYFGNAVRMALELGLFRPPQWVDKHLVENGSKPNPWVNLKGVATEEEQREALNRERTWLLVFVIDRNMSAVMGRPYLIHEAKPLLLPLHPMSLPFDLGVIAHQELQTIIGQVMDTFRERIYGLSTASDEMPSPIVMKLFNSRMDDWQQRWCPIPGEPIANNLLFYFHSSKLFLNTFPLHTMLRTNSAAVSDPSSVSSTISSAMSIMDLGHSYAELGVFRHCPDVNFLLLLYAAVFLLKVKASNTRFTSLVDDEAVQQRMTQCIIDCRNASAGEGHASATCAFMLRALLGSWKAMGVASAIMHDGETNTVPVMGHGFDASAFTGGVPIDPGLATPTGPPSAAPYAFISSTPFAGGGGNGGSGTRTPNPNGGTTGLGLSDPLDHFFADTNFFNSVLVSQGADGFFSWADGLGSATDNDWAGLLVGEDAQASTAALNIQS
ncbi:hypothetical protein T439DRAFT_184423 [Meredithblackwellia eburnea MCA 4105]